MDFGTIFISLIAFTIAALILPFYIGDNIQRNVDVLREHLRHAYSVNELNSELSDTDTDHARGLWDFLVGQELAHRIRAIQKQHHVPVIMGALVVEVLIFALAAHRVARGGKTPGAIEEVVVALSFLLIAMSVYITYRAIKSNAYFLRYLKKFEEYTALWRRHKIPQNSPQ